MNALLNTLLPIHVAAGGLALVLGAVALLARKGGTAHRRSGLLFVYVILVDRTAGGGKNTWLEVVNTLQPFTDQAS